MRRASVRGLSSGARIATIEQVASDRVTVVDQFGGRFEVIRTLLPGRSATPREGETWVIDHSLGQWRLAAYVDTEPDRAKTVVETLETDALAEAGLLATFPAGLSLMEFTAWSIGAGLVSTFNLGLLGWQTAIRSDNTMRFRRFASGAWGPWSTP